MNILTRTALCLALLCAARAAAAGDGELECITTEWKLLGKNHAVCVQAFTDPDVAGIACYISQAKTGGISGTVGLAEDPSNFSISCVRSGEVRMPDNLPRKATVFKESTSVFFKATRVTRIWDKERNTLVYMALSRKLIDGSPFNAVSAVSLP